MFETLDEHQKHLEIYQRLYRATQQGAALEANLAWWGASSLLLQDYEDTVAHLIQKSIKEKEDHDRTA